MLQLPSVMELVPQMDEPDPELLWMVSDDILFVCYMPRHCSCSSHCVA
jgi:hypothetical protein